MAYFVVDNSNLYKFGDTTMADMELVQTVKQGRDAVAKWREDHPGEILDLYQCFMSHVRIPMVDLRGADMRDGDFMGAMMRLSLIHI